GPQALAPSSRDVARELLGLKAAEQISDIVIHRAPYPSRSTNRSVVKLGPPRGKIQGQCVLFRASHYPLG
ncbi:MAG: hypothetical protein AB7E52_08825, partial [Bdellovibrionales bacterium]